MEARVYNVRTVLTAWGCSAYCWQNNSLRSQPSYCKKKISSRSAPWCSHFASFSSNTGSTIPTMHKAHQTVQFARWTGASFWRFLDILFPIFDRRVVNNPIQVKGGPICLPDVAKSTKSCFTEISKWTTNICAMIFVGILDILKISIL
jgi:hypothetical protein